MRKEWECPDNCPNRKPACQNPNTCEIYRKRIARDMKMRGEKKIYPSSYAVRSVANIKGTRRNYEWKGQEK